jgi:hypothetical protein
VEGIQSAQDAKEKAMKCEAIHCPNTDTVRFAIYPDGLDGPRIIARIRDRTLQERFGAHDNEASLIQACQAYFDQIEAKALEHYVAAPTLPVVLALADFSGPCALADAFCS